MKNLLDDEILFLVGCVNKQITERDVLGHVLAEVERSSIPCVQTLDEAIPLITCCGRRSENVNRNFIMLSQLMLDLSIPQIFEGLVLHCS